MKIITKEKILEISSNELVVFLNNNNFTCNEYSIILDNLENAINENPQKFLDNLNSFINLKDYYATYIFSFLLKWCVKNENNEEYLDKLFDYVKNYVLNMKFWIKDLTYIIKDENNMSLYIILPLIHTFYLTLDKLEKKGILNKKFMIKSIKIALMILEQSLILISMNKNEYESKLNSIIGHSLNILINYIIELRKLGHKYKIKSSCFERETLKKIDVLFNMKIKNIYEFFGMRIKAFYLLNKKWTKNKLKELLYEESDLWDVFISAQLKNYKKSNYMIYKLMKENYKKGIEIEDKTGATRYNIFEEIVNQYLNNKEKLKDKDSLIRMILEKCNNDIILKFLSTYHTYVYNIYDKSPLLKKKKIRKKTSILCNWVYENKLKGKKLKWYSKEEKNLIYCLFYLVSYLPSINEKNFDWIIKGVPYASEITFVEKLYKVYKRGDSYKYLAKLILEKLKTDTPKRSKYEITTMLHFLISKGMNDEVNQICEIYKKRGIDILKY